MPAPVPSNAGVIWTVFDSWEERAEAGLDLDTMVGQLWGQPY